MRRANARLVHTTREGVVAAAQTSRAQEAIEVGNRISTSDERTVLNEPARELIGPDDEPTTIRPAVAEADADGDADAAPEDHDRQIAVGPNAVAEHQTRKLPAMTDAATGWNPAALPPDPVPTRASSRGPVPRGRIGKYELRDKLARGAFGVVYTARDPSLERDVAIKVLRPTHLTNAKIVQRFLQEARATARISHPGIVTIHDCGQVETSGGATAYIAMELLSGENLTRRLARTGQLAPPTAIGIVRQIASALEAAHRAHVLHRDLKPDNIFLVPDPAMPNGERVKVLDFGLAKLGDDGHTHVQTVFGTPRYMSPEQCRSAALVDHRSDIYSLGCVLFELLTGHTPFDGEVRQLLERHQHLIAPRATLLAPELHPALEDLIADMLAKDPRKRPQTMGAVQRALHEIGDRLIPVIPAADVVAPAPAHAPPPGQAFGPHAADLLLAAQAPLPAALDPAMSGELLVPPSGPRSALVDAPAPAAAVPRSRRRRRVARTGLGILILVVPPLIAWILRG